MNHHPHPRNIPTVCLFIAAMWVIQQQQQVMSLSTSIPRNRCGCYYTRRQKFSSGSLSSTSLNFVVGCNDDAGVNAHDSSNCYSREGMGRGCCRSIELFARRRRVNKKKRSRKSGARGMMGKIFGRSGMDDDDGDSSYDDGFMNDDALSDVGYGDSVEGIVGKGEESDMVGMGEGEGEETASLTQDNLRPNEDVTAAVNATVADDTGKDDAEAIPANALIVGITDSSDLTLAMRTGSRNEIMVGDVAQEKLETSDTGINEATDKKRKRKTKKLSIFSRGQNTKVSSSYSPTKTQETSLSERKHPKQSNKNSARRIFSIVSPFGLKGLAKYVTLAAILLAAPAPKQLTARMYGEKFYAGVNKKSSIPFTEPQFYRTPLTESDDLSDLKDEVQDEKEIDDDTNYDLARNSDVEAENRVAENGYDDNSRKKPTLPAKVERRKVSKFEEEKRQAPSMVAAAVRKVGPSVVRIDTKRFIGPGRSYSSPFGGLFDDFDHQEENGQGSGIIFHEKGLILTNAHVVTRADEVMVTLTDGRRYKAVVKGTDELTDLAVLEMKSFTDLSENEISLDRAKTKATKSKNNAWEGEPLPVGIFGNSDEIEVGEYVIAVGNPVGLDNTVTMGIISAIKRSSEEVGIPNKKVPFIQTDAAINPGNSGGPLVNGDGEIIGINTCIRANAEGIGFAIPINKAKSIVYRLAEGQTIQHGFVGMNVISITPDLARQQNKDPNSPAGMIPEVYGAMITMVRADAPAANCGLRRFDVVLEIGGSSIKNAGDVIKVFDEAPVGEEIDVRVLRNNREFIVSVVPDDLTKKLLEARNAHEKHLQEIPRQDGNGEGSPRIFILPFQ